ncbi:MAG: bifunctional dihydropteridine reductase/dihydrofolate reductase TmpR [Geitlerinemataceae cyanobacterium]
MMLKKALVTGSAKGIGRAIALKLASLGCDVAFHYNNSADAANEASQTATTYGVKSIALQADVTKPDRAKSLVEDAAEQLDGLSIVVNTVGNYDEKPICQTSVEEWHDAIDSNLNSAFYVTQAAIPYLKAANWGRVINFAFASAQNVTSGDVETAYRIAKTGVIIYTKSIAKELMSDNITANIVSPGVAETSVGLEETIPNLPAKRPATVDDISNAVSFFASPEASYITGQVLEVSGGWRL